MENKKAEKVYLVDLTNKPNVKKLETLLGHIDSVVSSREELEAEVSTVRGKLIAKFSLGWHLDSIRDETRKADENKANARIGEINKNVSAIRKSPDSIATIEESLNELSDTFEIDGLNPNERLTALDVGIEPVDDSKSVVRNLQGMIVAIASLQEAENGEVEILPDVEYYGETPLPSKIFGGEKWAIRSVIEAIECAEMLPLELAPLKIGGSEYKSGTLSSIRTDMNVSIDIRLSAQKVTLPECASQMIHKKQGRFAGVIEDMKKTQREEDKAKAAAEKLEEKKNKLTTFVIELPVKQVPIYFEQYTGEKAGRKKEKTLRNALSASEALFTDVNSRSKSDAYKAAGKAVKALIKE
tara:strand:+ start:845 stop:1909 length:1065 start_codon:yes stop_codon:yes gene_type:complete